MSKGDNYRPVDHNKWSDNYDKIFNKTITVKEQEIKLEVSVPRERDTHSNLVHDIHRD